MYKEELEYKLITPVKYAKDGKQEYIDTIIIPAPTAFVLGNVAIIEKEIAKANNNQIKSAQDLLSTFSEDQRNSIIDKREELQAEEEKAKKEQTYEQVLSELLNNGLDFLKCSTALCKILVDPMCKAQINGTDPIKEHDFNSLKLVDIKRLLARYIKDFLLSSPEQN